MYVLNQTKRRNSFIQATNELPCVTNKIIMNENVKKLAKFQKKNEIFLNINQLYYNRVIELRICSKCTYNKFPLIIQQ